MRFSVLIEIYCGFMVLGEFVCGFAVSTRSQRPPPYWSLKGHSCQMGMASVAAVAGLLVWLKKVLGCWSGLRYLLQAL